ncbi:sensor histidine kinase [Actinoplanes sp. NPDC020271]|uniref:sensor histidine kinase n=1 Tax=Actinoplanes sp. NPDC020271 TaxID=3363896 RepID=UPI0037A32D20
MTVVFRLLTVVPVAILGGGLFLLLHTMIAAPFAAVAVAILVNPASVRAERYAERLLHGRRPSPYTVLAGLGTLTGTDLAQVPETLGRALGARLCRLTVHRPGLPDRTYAWPGPASADAVLTLPIVRGGEQLGSITVDRASAADATDGHRRRLVQDVADGLAAVLAAHRLGIDLERQLRAVRAHAAGIAGSRRRLVAEMDAERRRIERDLHDGAQHHLVSLRLALGLAEHQAGIGRLDDAVTALDRIAARIDDAEAILARTVSGMTSPVLAQRGLVAALRAELGAGVPVEVTGMDDGRRFPAEPESAVWFCCLEAVGNARKHAPGASIRVTLACTGARLTFGIHDDGPGWDTTAGTGSPGRGMRNVMARVTAAGGLVTVRSAPGEGTRVDGWVALGDAPPDDSPLAGAVRAAVQQAASLYGDAEPVERLRRIRAGLDQPGTRRDAVLAAWSALGALDELVRDDPPGSGAQHLRHRLDRIRAESREYAEVTAIDELRSDPGDLSPADVATAARLLGDAGPDPVHRLGLEPDAGPAQIADAVSRALTVWRARASHPGTARSVRRVAATVVRSCEHLLLTTDRRDAGPLG